jgi:hypothetical protein
LKPWRVKTELYFRRFPVRGEGLGWARQVLDVDAPSYEIPLSVAVCVRPRQTETATLGLDEGVDATEPTHDGVCLNIVNESQRERPRSVRVRSGCYLLACVYMCVYKPRYQQKIQLIIGSNCVSSLWVHPVYGFLFTDTLRRTC